MAKVEVIIVALQCAEVVPDKRQCVLHKTLDIAAQIITIVAKEEGPEFSRIMFFF
jgi:hypothetical protein